MKKARQVSPTSNTARPPHRWYGWQTLALDGAASVMTVTAIPLSEHAPWPAGVLGYSAAATYVFGAPIVHLMKRQPARAAGSFALRVGLPLAVFSLLQFRGRCPANNEADDVRYCQVQPRSLIGGLAAAVAASAIDGGLLAWKPIETTSAVTLLPTFSLDGTHASATGVTIGIRGTM